MTLQNQTPEAKPHASEPVPSGQPPSRRSAITGTVVALLLLLGLSGLTWYLLKPDATPAAAGGFRGAPASTVGVATAELASIPIVIDALGTVTPQASVKVRPQVSGTLTKILFQEGQMVKAGQLLATIDPRQFELALMQASGQRQRDQAQLDSAKVTLKRFTTLLAQDSIARQETDTQAALVKQLEGTVAIDMAAEGLAKLNLDYTRVVAPVSGRVGLRLVDVGNLVSSSDTNGLVLITQLSPISVVFSVPQDRVAELQQNISAKQRMSASALDRSRATVLEVGSFATLDNQVDVTTGTVKAKALFANDKQALFPNQFVNIKLLVSTLTDAVVVPVTALRQGANGDFVYVLNAESRTVSIRPVKRGQATVEKIAITEGLKAGERVITEGADRLKEGARVVLPGDAPRTGGAGAGGDKSKRANRDKASANPASAPVGTADGYADTASAPGRKRPASQAAGS
ncbi:Multidrug resistance protein MdtA [Polaromonas vacuolata]|uniref:Multidrug resistance protein MdtA n=1 Tax=Polaromonas vacuolata TaxID=37448 RepID=A0A6H2H6E1_9BURK|nr:efflux RND transporter periplasmic adaptor subunit [Polaromonas vacuolata]QJC55429.1 Multidrug resistance protein MdtA [Polaromonas vacuolata]